MMQYLESTGYKQSTGGIEPTKEKKNRKKTWDAAPYTEHHCGSWHAIVEVYQ